MAVRTIWLSHSGWTSSLAYFYANTSTGKFYTDSACTVEIERVPIPTRTSTEESYGYKFLGYYQKNDATGTEYIDENGKILSSLAAVTSNTTIYLKSEVYSYRVWLTDGEGSGGSGSIWQIKTAGNSGYFFDDAACYNPISSVAIPTRSGYVFKGYYSDAAGTTQYIDGSGQILSAFPHTATAARTIYAVWEEVPTESTFGSVTDYFSLASSTMIAESSDSGDGRQHICAYNATSEAATTNTSNIWRNPRVTYRVVGDMTLSVTLGAAFAGEGTSGYMISSVEIETAIGEPPSVTISAVANEGVDAVKTYTVSIPISARHRPQNLLSAVSGGGDLQRLSLAVRGDPVVVAENDMPCASDMTHGRIEVAAETAAYNNETAPSAGEDFVLTAAPVARSGTGYKVFSVSLRKEIA